MKWNKGKFQLLRLGPNNDLKNCTEYFSPDMEYVVESKESVKDLGIHVDHKMTYRVQRQKSLTKVVQKLGWIRRMFVTRSTSFLKTIWNSLCQPHIDYGSVIVTPPTKY